MLLKLGSEGEDVKKLQRKLGVDPIGKFGPKTDAAVKEWQSKNGLTADGIVGNGTWGKMFSESTVSAPTLITEPAPVASAGGLKLERLRGHIPDAVIAQIPDTAAKFSINTPLRLAHFLAQANHESGGFRATQENLNYSAKGLTGTFKKYFPSEAAAIPYAKNPLKIASKVYGGRMGNGPESTQEGYKFRGRGFLQTTGKENYTRFTKFIGEDCVSNPDLVSSKYPLASAAFFFTSNNLWPICDKGSSVEVVTQLTKRINGGTIGLSERIKEFNHFYKLLT
jgi:putative chitinase